MSDTIYTEYFSVLRDSIQKYGEKTILFMQVGAFLEMYGTTPQTHSPLQQTRVFEICQLCDLNISEKKQTFQGDALFMAGFRDFAAEKYIQKCIESGYTVVVYLQEKNEKNTTRVLHAIYSPGTYLPYEADTSCQLTNNIMCIWVETFSRKFAMPSSSSSASIGCENGDACSPSTMVYGVAVSNIYTGQSYLFEHQSSSSSINTTTFDELERLVSTYHPSEVVLVCGLEDQKQFQIIQYSGIKTSTIHRIPLTDPKSVNCTKQTYIQSILANQFQEDTYHVCMEFSQYPIATQSFCFLLNFIKEHNPNLVKNIALPQFTNTSTRTVLANHTLKQLNIIDDASEDAKHVGMLSSVSTFLNKCCSSIGRRRFYTQITNPVFNVEWLQKEYDMIGSMLQSPELEEMSMLRKQIREICDLEKASRQLVTRRIYPNTIQKLYKSVCAIQQIHICFHESQHITEYITSDFLPSGAHPQTYLETIIETVLQTIQTYVIVDVCGYYNSISCFDESIIQPGISETLDNLLQTKKVYETQMSAIHSRLNEIMRGLEGSNINVEYVKLHETEKSGVSLQITKHRAKTLKKHFDDWMAKQSNASLVIDDVLVVPIREIQFKTANASSDEIRITAFTQLSNELLNLKTRINVEIVAAYHHFLGVFEKKCYVMLEHLAAYVSKADVLQSKTFVAKEYNYCAPTLCLDETASAFVKAEGLRHCLIEQLQTSELYVSNTLELGDGPQEPRPYSPLPNGMLLFGTNAVGKTSLIRALGIAVVMAQSGMYVPCSNFTYKPFTALYSRILGNDNIFKGLSTFAVEMTELRMILNMADENSLVLGDELCSGTETESALSIFMAGLLDLHAKQTKFVFATHFHEIVKFEETKQLTKLALKHLSVFYDREHDCLVYDRKLKDGAGTRMYGLEVCKSLHLPYAFLEQAYRIRNKYFPETKGELQATQTKYNAQKIKGMCEQCGIEMGMEVHHLQEQHLANEDGFINHFHKNHPANLMVLCEPCHSKMHSSPNNANTVAAAPKKQRRRTTNGKMVVL